VPTIVIVALSVALIVVAVYTVSFRGRRDFSVPIIPNTGKKFIGGALMLCAACVIAYGFLKLDKGIAKRFSSSV
jgi:hypothetical protein